MLIVLGDLIADLSLHIQRFPIQAEGMYPLEFLDLGPGGAANVAIMAARLGLQVACLGEIGQDRFGEIVLEGLQAELIDATGVIRSDRAATPLAAVVVDQAGEPAYLGHPGSLRLRELPAEWKARIADADALFADGWAEHAETGEIVLEAFAIAQATGVRVFFDPGPGNSQFDLDWHLQAIALTDVLLLNQQEAERLAGSVPPEPALRSLGPQLVVIKRGPEGCVAENDQQRVEHHGYSVEMLDATGAGDSFDAAVICGFLTGLKLEAYAKLANAAGAAKVQKRGTGLNLPTLDEVKRVLEQAGDEVAGWDPEPPQAAAG